MEAPVRPQDSAAPASTAQAAEKGTRLVALDALRGLTIALMVLVNNPGSGRDSYPPLLHAEWHGWTLTDTVFPTFLWIVGVAIWLSLGKRLARGIPRTTLLAQAFRRAAILFAIGLVLYAIPHFNPATQRIMGVLQRIAICYLVVSAIFLYTGMRGQICWLVGLMAAYWALMTLVPVPGYGPGRLDVEGNLAHYVDNIVLGQHNYRATKTWDPEGLVSTLPSIATTLFGLLAGRLIAMRRSLKDLEPVDAHQQETVDGFLLPLHGGARFHGLCRLRSTGGRARLAQTREAAGDSGNERHRGVRGIGLCGHRAGPDPVAIRRRNDFAAAIPLPDAVRPARFAGERLVVLRPRVCRGDVRAGLRNVPARLVRTCLNVR
jgi:hypothetical protein